MKPKSSKEFDRVTAILATRIRELRLARGLSQEELADEAGCHRTYVGMLEREQANPSLWILSLISEALGVRLEEFLVVAYSDIKDG